MSFAAFWVLDAVFGTDGVGLYSCVDFDPIAMRMKIRITNAHAVVPRCSKASISKTGMEEDGDGGPIGVRAREAVPLYMAKGSRRSQELTQKGTRDEISDREDNSCISPALNMSI